jgi:hypothetical protein
MPATPTVQQPEALFVKRASIAFMLTICTQIGRDKIPYCNATLTNGGGCYNAKRQEYSLIVCIALNLRGH